MEGGLLLDVVIREGASVLKLLSSEDETLLVRWDTLLVLDLRLYIVNGVGRLDLQGDGLAGQSLDEDLHTTAETKDEMESRFLLDVVVGESAAVFELFTGEDEALLIWRDAFLILDLRLDVINGVRGLDFKGNSLSSQGLNEDLHATTETKNQVKGRLFLDIVVRKSTTILELFTGEDQTLLIRGNAFLVLDLRLDIIDGVRRFNLEGDGLASEGLYEDLHSSTETEDQVEGGLLLDVIIRKGSAVLELLARKDEALLVRWDALLVLDFGLDIVNSVRGLDLEGDSLSSERLYEDLHGWG